MEDISGHYCDAPNAEPKMKWGESNKSDQPDAARTLMDIMACGPVQDSVLCHLDTKSILQLTLTTKAFTGLFRVAINGQCKINEQLHRFFGDNQLAFRNLQAKTNALITDHFAYHFFNRSSEASFIRNNISPSLTLRVRHGNDTDAFDNLLHKCGFKLVSSLPDHEYVPTSKSIIYNKDQSHSDLPIIVRIVVTKESPLSHLFTESQTTGEMTFITWKKAYCLFPYPTFYLKKTFLLRAGREVCPDGLPPFEEYGLSLSPIGLQVFLDTTRANARKEDGMQLGSRAVKDKYTWKLQLDESGITASDMPEYLTDYAEFTVKIRAPENDPRKHYKVSICKLSTPSLRYDYIMDLDGKRNIPLAERYLDVASIQIFTLNAEERQKLLNVRSNGHMIRYSIRQRLTDWIPLAMPGTWKFWDEEVQSLVEQKFPELTKSSKG